MVADQIISTWPKKYPKMNVRWTSMSPKGNRVVIKFWNMNFCINFGCDNDPKGTLKTRMVSFDRNFNNPIGIWGANGHSDKCITDSGREVVFFDTSQYIYMGYLDTGQIVELFPTDKTSGGAPGFHESCNNYDTPGWGLLSSYATVNQIGNWQSKQLMMVELRDNPRIWRIGHTMSQQEPGKKKSYFTEAFATISRDGKYVWWGSNWRDYYGNRIEAYQITLPPTWYEDLSGSN